MLRSLEAELRRKDRLSALGEVAVGIAHEIRNPLGTIKTSAELVRKREGISAGDVKLLGYVVDEVRRIDSLIDEFLSFARPSAPHMRRLPLSAVAQKVGDFCEPELSSHKVTLALTDDSEGAMVQGDEDHLFQAALNLVLNAIDAMAGGGSMEIRSWRDGKFAKLSFRDSGTGIPLEIAGKNLRSFRHHQATRHRPWPCQGLLGDGKPWWHGGPAEPSGGRQLLHPRSAHRRLRMRPMAHTILLADDEARLADVIGVALEQAGYRVLMAASGEPRPCASWKPRPCIFC